MQLNVHNTAKCILIVTVNSLTSLKQTFFCEIMNLWASATSPITFSSRVLGLIQCTLQQYKKDHHWRASFLNYIAVCTTGCSKSSHTIQKSVLKKSNGQNWRNFSMFSLKNCEREAALVKGPETSKPHRLTEHMKKTNVKRYKDLLKMLQHHGTPLRYCLHLRGSIQYQAVFKPTHDRVLTGSLKSQR